MDANIIFGKALGLGSGWKVVNSEMNVEGRELKLWLDFDAGSQFACSECEEFCPVHYWNSPGKMDAMGAVNRWSWLVS